MKTIHWILVAGCVLFASSPARAGWMEVRNFFQDGQLTPVGVIYVGQDINPKLGWYGFASVAPAYAEGYVGPTFAPVPWMQLGLAAGLEQGSRSARLGSYAWVGGKGADVLFIAENGGGSGRYLKLDASYRVVGPVSLGWYHDYFLGGGPSIKLTKPHGVPVSIWSAALDQALIVTLRYHF